MGGQAKTTYKEEQQQLGKGLALYKNEEGWQETGVGRRCVHKRWQEIGHDHEG